MPRPEDDPRSLPPSEKFKLLADLAKTSASAEGDEQSLADVVHDLLEISPQLQFQGKKVTDAMDEYMAIDTAVESREGDAFGQLHPEVYVILRFGFYTRIYEAYKIFHESILRFLRDPNNRPESDVIQRKFRSRPENLSTYKLQFGSLLEAAQSMDIAVGLQWGEWMNRSIPANELSPENLFLPNAGELTGGVLIEKAKSFFGKRRTQLDDEEYVSLAELLLGQLREERSKNKKVQPSATSDDDPMVKNLFKVAVCNYRPIPRDEVKHLPKAMSETIASGEPLYRYFAAFMTEFVDALGDSTHPGHVLTCQLLELLNTFEVLDWGGADSLRQAPFTHELGFGLTQRDFLRTGDYQQLVCNLEDLAVLHPENLQFYHKILEQLIISSRNYNVGVVCEGEDVERLMFDSRRRVTGEGDFGEKLRELTHLSEDRKFHAGFSESIVQMHLLPLIGQKFYLGLETRELEENAYVINVQMSVRDGEETHKLRFQIRLVNNLASVYFPVFNRELIKSDTEITAIEMVRALMSLVDASYGLPTVSHATDADAANEKKVSNRQAKIAEYQRRQQQRIAEESMVEDDVEKTPNETTELLTSSSAAERELASHYLPNEVIIPSSLQRKIDGAGKKGSEARILGIVNDFVTAYNAAPPHEKPGEGEQMTEVYGPDRQKVWRLKPVYGVRCIIVDLKDGKALLVDADSRTNIYKLTVKEMRRMIRVELEKYFRRG